MEVEVETPSSTCSPRSTSYVSVLHSTGLAAGVGRHGVAVLGTLLRGGDRLAEDFGGMLGSVEIFVMLCRLLVWARAQDDRQPFTEALEAVREVLRKHRPALWCSPSCGPALFLLSLLSELLGDSSPSVASQAAGCLNHLLRVAGVLSALRQSWSCKSSGPKVVNISGDASELSPVSLVQSSNLFKLLGSLLSLKGVEHAGLHLRVVACLGVLLLSKPEDSRALKLFSGSSLNRAFLLCGDVLKKALPGSDRPSAVACAGQGPDLQACVDLLCDLLSSDTTADALLRHAPFTDWVARVPSCVLRVPSEVIPLVGCVVA
eukprot:RCo041522